MKFATHPQDQKVKHRHAHWVHSAIQAFRPPLWSKKTAVAVISQLLIQSVSDSHLKVEENHEVCTGCSALLQRRSGHSNIAPNPRKDLAVWLHLYKRLGLQCGINSYCPSCCSNWRTLSDRSWWDQSPITQAEEHRKGHRPQTLSQSTLQMHNRAEVALPFDVTQHRQQFRSVTWLMDTLHIPHGYKLSCWSINLMQAHAAILVGVNGMVAGPSVNTCWTPWPGLERKHPVVSGISKRARFQAAANGDLDGSRWERNATASCPWWFCQHSTSARAQA